MPLAGSESALSAALRAAMLADERIRATDDTDLPTEQKGLTALCDVIASVVLAHIVANAAVTVAPGIAVATAGTAAAQTGATTAPGAGTVG